MCTRLDGKPLKAPRARKAPAKGQLSDESLPNAAGYGFVDNGALVDGGRGRAEGPLAFARCGSGIYSMDDDAYTCVPCVLRANTYHH